MPQKPPPRSTRLKSERVQEAAREALAWSLEEEAPLRLTLRFSSPQIGLLVTAIAAASAAVAGFEPEIAYRRGEVAVSIGSPGAVTESDLARARALVNLLTGMLEGAAGAESIRPGTEPNEDAAGTTAAKPRRAVGVEEADRATEGSRAGAHPATPEDGGS